MIKQYNWEEMDRIMAQETCGQLTKERDEALDALEECVVQSARRSDNMLETTNRLPHRAAIYDGIKVLARFGRVEIIKSMLEGPYCRVIAEVIPREERK